MEELERRLKRQARRIAVVRRTNVVAARNVGHPGAEQVARATQMAPIRQSQEGKR